MNSFLEQWQARIAYHQNKLLSGRSPAAPLAATTNKPVRHNIEGNKP